MEEKNVRASESGELKTLEVASPEIPMTKGAMRYLVELGKQTKDFEVVEIGGRIFTNTGTDGTLEEITPFETECPPSFETATLDGLVTWLHADVDKLFGGLIGCMFGCGSKQCRGSHSVIWPLARFARVWQMRCIYAEAQIRAADDAGRFPDLLADLL